MCCTCRSCRTKGSEWCKRSEAGPRTRTRKSRTAVTSSRSLAQWRSSWASAASASAVSPRGRVPASASVVSWSPSSLKSFSGEQPMKARLVSSCNKKRYACRLPPARWLPFGCRASSAMAASFTSSSRSKTCSGSIAASNCSRTRCAKTTFDIAPLSMPCKTRPIASSQSSGESEPSCETSVGSGCWGGETTSAETCSCCSSNSAPRAARSQVSGPLPSCAQRRWHARKQRPPSHTCSSKSGSTKTLRPKPAHSSRTSASGSKRPPP